MMSCNDWLKSVYSDGSKWFVSNPLPKKGEKITIALQVLEDSPVTSVYLKTKLKFLSVKLYQVTVMMHSC